METPICSAHKTPMVWKEAGVSKAGKPYEGFWSCKEKVNGSFCRAKPEMAKAPEVPQSYQLPVQPQSEYEMLKEINHTLQDIAQAIREGREKEPDISEL